LHISLLPSVTTIMSVCNLLRNYSTWILGYILLWRMFCLLFFSTGVENKQFVNRKLLTVGEELAVGATHYVNVTVHQS